MKLAVKDYTLDCTIKLTPTGVFVLWIVQNCPAMCTKVDMHFTVMADWYQHYSRLPQYDYKAEM